LPLSRVFLVELIERNICRWGNAKKIQLSTKRKEAVMLKTKLKEASMFRR
jgi:hypothetical protein